MFGNHPTDKYILLKKEIKKKFEKYLVLNDNDRSTGQSLWDTAKAVLEANLLYQNTFSGNSECIKINKPSRELKTYIHTDKV